MQYTIVVAYDDLFALQSAYSKYSDCIAGQEYLYEQEKQTQIVCSSNFKQMVSRAQTYHDREATDFDKGMKLCELASHSSQLTLTFDKVEEGEFFYRVLRMAKIVNEVCYLPVTKTVKG